MCRILADAFVAHHAMLDQKRTPRTLLCSRAVSMRLSLLQGRHYLKARQCAYSIVRGRVNIVHSRNVSPFLAAPARQIQEGGRVGGQATNLDKYQLTN